MGQLQGHDDGEEEEFGDELELVFEGLDDLESETDELVYELDEWTEDDRVVLRARLELLGVPHAWQSASLVVSAADEAWVERILDQVEEELTLRVDPNADQVAYDLGDWGDEERRALFDRLAEAGIAHAVDGDELFVQEIDEGRTDELIDAVLDPDAPAPSPEIAHDVMGQLFVAADRLRRDGLDHEGTMRLVDALRRADDASPPYGMDRSWWEDTLRMADDLATSMDTEAMVTSDVEQQAQALRDRLRPYV